MSPLIQNETVSFAVCEVERKAYGRIYPVNEVARLFAQLTGRRTLVAADLAIIANLGYTILWRTDE